MKNLKCECCGAPLVLSPFDGDMYVCEYCGSRYKSEHEDLPPIRIETFQNPIRTLCVKQEVDEDFLRNAPTEMIAEASMKEITNKLAESLADCLRIEREYNPATMRHIITARVRVVEADYRF